jgi:hypothetical protein
MYLSSRDKLSYVPLISVIASNYLPKMIYPEKMRTPANAIASWKPSENGKKICTKPTSISTQRDAKRLIESIPLVSATLENIR